MNDQKTQIGFKRTRTDEPVDDGDRGLKRKNFDEDKDGIIEKSKKSNSSIQNNIESMKEIIEQVCFEFVTKLKEDNKINIVPNQLMETIDLSDDEDDEQLKRAIEANNQINDIEKFNATGNLNVTCMKI